MLCHLYSAVYTAPKHTASTGSTVVSTVATIEDPVQAVAQVAQLQQEAAEGTLSVGGTSVMSMSGAQSLVSTGPAVASITPNIGSATANSVTTITLIGDSSSSFDSTTRVSVGGTIYTPAYVLTATSLKLNVSSIPGAVSFPVMLVGGSNSKTFYQYNDTLTYVTNCLPTSGVHTMPKHKNDRVLSQASKLAEMQVEAQ